MVVRRMDFVWDGDFLNAIDTWTYTNLNPPSFISEIRKKIIFFKGERGGPRDSPAP